MHLQVGFSDAHGSGGRLSAMAFDANQRRLLTGGSDGVLRFWNANNGSVLREVSDPVAVSLAAPIQTVQGKCAVVRFPCDGSMRVGLIKIPRVRLSRQAVSSCDDGLCATVHKESDRRAGSHGNDRRGDPAIC